MKIQNSIKRYLGPVAIEFYNAKTGLWRTSKPVFDRELCVLCKKCIDSCPLGIIEFINEIDKTSSFQYEYCKGCGVCSNVCHKHAISMIQEGSSENY